MGGEGGRVEGEVEEETAWEEGELGELWVGSWSGGGEESGWGGRGGCWGESLET